MKKCVSILMVLLVTFLTGCSQVSLQEDSTFAVDSQLIELYGTDQTEVMDLYELSEDNKDENWTNYYLGKVYWCGIEQETKFLFTDQKLTFAKTKIIMDNDDNTKEMVSSIVSQFKNQFGDPTSILTQFDWVPEPKQDYQEDNFIEQEELFCQAETGALLCLSYAMEDSEMNPCYIECVFLRNETKNPHEVHVVLQIGDSSFGYLSEEVDLNLF